MKEPTHKEISNLVTFGRDKDGKLFVDWVDEARRVFKARRVDEADRVDKARRVNRAGFVGKAWQASWVLDAKSVEYVGEIEQRG